MDVNRVYLIDPPRLFDDGSSRGHIRLADKILFMDLLQVHCSNTPFLPRNLDTMIHLLKGNIGVGILAMPNAFSHAGLAIGGFGTLLMGVICTHCMHMLVSENRFKPVETKRGIRLIDCLCFRLTVPMSCVDGLTALLSGSQKS